MTPITREDFFTELGYLASAFDKKPNDVYTAEAYDCLKDLTNQEFKSVIKAAIRGSNYFPRIAELKTLGDWVMSKRSKKPKIDCCWCDGSGRLSARCSLDVLDSSGKQANGNIYYFICNCENGLNYQGPAAVKWTNTLEPNFYKKLMPWQDV